LSPFKVEFQSGLSPFMVESIHGWVYSGWVPSVLSPFTVESLWGWVHLWLSPFGVESIRGCVYSALGPIGVQSIWGWVFLGSVVLGSVGESPSPTSPESPKEQQ
jgi:hypothetical protein